jgi:hypothetical protein
LPAAQEHPGYNFIGLIIGPRGNTQKRMQVGRAAALGRRCKAWPGRLAAAR